MKTMVSPFIRKSKILMKVAPDIGSTRVCHLKLKMVRRAIPAHLEADLEGFRKFERNHPTHGHEAAATMEVVVEPNTGFS